MKVTREDFDWAASQGRISASQADALWKALEERKASQPQFTLLYVTYYFGALIVISAMGWFMTLGWERFGGLGIALVAVAYAVCFVGAGRKLWSDPRFKVPGGLLYTMAVWMAPLAIYGIERATGLWPQETPGAFRDYHVWIKGSWILMEAGAILAALAALRLVRFPFLTFPLAFSLWYMSMDVVPLLFGRTDFTYTERLWVSAVFGMVMLLISYLVDHRWEDDYAFWGYLFGGMAFWGGLSLMQSGSEFRKFLYCLINLVLMLVSVLLARRVLLVFGALGVFGYLGYLSHRVFRDSLLFPFALSGLGLAIILLVSCSANTFH